MVAEVNAASAVPSISLDMGLNSLGAQGFLGAVAGFTNATGTTGTSLKIQGQGRTQAQIMKSLIKRLRADLCPAASALRRLQSLKILSDYFR